MVKNSREGNRERAARRRADLGNRGVEQFQVIAPPEAKLLIRAAAKLMTRTNDPLEPRAALRQIGGANEPGQGEAVAELEAARARVVAAEQEAAQRLAESEALQAERDTAKAAEVAEREKAQAAATAAQEANGQAKEALGRAKKAEAAIRKVKNLPGLKGRLVRWLAGDMLE